MEVGFQLIVKHQDSHSIKFLLETMINKLNGTHQLSVYADDVNLLGDNIDTIKKNTQTLIDTSKEIGLEVNTEKIEYMLI
jgi:hypothetical protein